MTFCKKNQLNKIYDDGIGTFNKRYILLEQLSSGGMSVTFKVQDIYKEYFNDSKELVMKIPNKELLEKKDIDAFLYSEYKFLREINHENIVKVYDFGIDYEVKVPYIIMEYLDGELLEETHLYNMSKDEKYLLFNTLLNTVNYLHNQKVVHGDITPKNIMISANKKVTLFDFGISQSEDGLNDFTLDCNTLSAYNLKYSAPEILQGKEPSSASDIFSLALTLYELFSMELPFQENSIELEKKPLTYSNCSKKIPFLLRKWFIDVLETNPNKRRQTLPVVYKFLMF